MILGFTNNDDNRVLENIKISRELQGENSEKQRSQQTGDGQIQSNKTPSEITGHKLDEIQTDNLGISEAPLPVTCTQQNNTPITSQNDLVQVNQHGNENSASISSEDEDSGECARTRGFTWSNLGIDT